MPHILVVDDGLPICDVLATAFTDEGWSVQACTSPKDALEIARQWVADAVVLDLKLPGMDAATFPATYRRDVRADTPVVLVSAASGLDGHAARLGVNGVVAKPFDLDTLCETVRRRVAGGLVTGGASDGH
jgi:two-component system, OmpR family, response regulator CpxR